MNGVGPRIVSLVFSNTVVLGKKGEKAGEEGEIKGSREGSRTGKSNEGKPYCTSALSAPFFFQISWRISQSDPVHNV